MLENTDRFQHIQNGSNLSSFLYIQAQHRCCPFRWSQHDFLFVLFSTFLCFTEFSHRIPWLSEPILVQIPPSPAPSIAERFAPPFMMEERTLLPIPPLLAYVQMRMGQELPPLAPFSRNTVAQFQLRALNLAAWQSV
jgi:hypothetical protein